MRVVYDPRSDNGVSSGFENEERIESINRIYKKMYKLKKSHKTNKRNTSGVVGVSWDKLHRRWISTIGFCGESIFLGGFKDFDRAVEARLRAEEMLFYPGISSGKGLQKELTRRGKSANI